jgi:hypothetical protein
MPATTALKLVVLLALLALVGCARADPLEKQKADLEAMRAKWKATMDATADERPKYGLLQLDQICCQLVVLIGPVPSLPLAIQRAGALAAGTVIAGDGRGITAFAVWPRGGGSRWHGSHLPGSTNSAPAILQKPSCWAQDTCRAKPK